MFPASKECFMLKQIFWTSSQSFRSSRTGENPETCQQVLSGCWSRQASKNHWWSELTLAVGMAVPRVTEWSKRTHRSVLSCCLQAGPTDSNQCKGSLQKWPCQRISSGWALGRKNGREEGEIPTKHLVRAALIYPAWFHNEWWEPGCVLVWHRARELIVKWPLR